MKEGAYAEVVSEFEYEMALKLEINPKRIIFNGPIKSNKILKKALINKSMVNADNITEVKRIDFGGGLAGRNPRWDEDIEEHDLPSAKEYSEAILNPIAKVIKNNNINPKIFFEPGRTLVESTT